MNLVNKRGFEVFILIVVIISTIGMFVNTIPNLGPIMLNILSIGYIIVTIIFSFELILRIVYNLKHKNYNYFYSFYFILDTIVLITMYLYFVISFNLVFLRLIRVFRVFKLTKGNEALLTIKNVFYNQRAPLIASSTIILILMVICSYTIYLFEHNAQPDKFISAFSGLWWGVATFTTVGYGDVYPITIAGKIFTSLCAILGIALVAIPTGIISAGFVEEFTKKKDK